MTKRFRVVAIVVFVLAVCSGSVFAYSADSKKIELIIDNSRDNFATEMETVEDFLAEHNIIVAEEDTIDKPLDAALSDGDVITIHRATPVIISLDGVPRMTQTRMETVGELLKSIGDLSNIEYQLDNVSMGDALSSNMVIQLSSVMEKKYTITEEIGFTTEVQETDELAFGTEKIVQEGSKGELQITMTERYIGGELSSTEETERKVVREPSNTIIKKGTARKITTSTGDFTYAKALNVTATGYTPYDPGCTGITATGVPAKRGIIAVDPKVIPMGTKLYIPGYGNAVAADTGGAIKGNKIDLCYETVAEAYQWGIRNVTVYILE